MLDVEYWMMGGFYVLTPTGGGDVWKRPTWEGGMLQELEFYETRENRQTRSGRGVVIRGAYKKRNRTTQRHTDGTEDDASGRPRNENKQIKNQ